MSCGKCNSANCYTCVNGPNECTACTAGKFLYSKTCVLICPNGYYGYNKECLKCQSPCATCNTTATTCITCITDYYLDVGTNSQACVQTCTNTNYIGNDGTCKQCTSNCKTCSKILSNCTSCD
jgi:proprotein convertase subtilisin/kexin type 5